LNDAINQEKLNRDEFFALPEHYLEVSLLLLESAAADITDNEQVRLKVQCLREIRHQKTLAGLKEIDGDPIKVRF
jgi:GINS complex subunit 2